MTFTPRVSPRLPRSLPHSTMVRVITLLKTIVLFVVSWFLNGWRKRRRLQKQRQLADAERGDGHSRSGSQVPVIRLRPDDAPAVVQGSGGNSRVAAVAAAAESSEAANDGGLQPLLILYASQTGTAEQFARTLHREARANGFRPKVECIEDYHDAGGWRLAEEGHVLFLCATYGEGDATDDCARFFRWTRQKASEAPDLLAGVSYAVFGLGDRSYGEQFCAIGRYFDSRFGQMGATRVCKAGEGDSNARIVDDFGRWRELMWPKLRKQAGVGGVAAGAYSLRTADGGQLNFSFPITDGRVEEEFVARVEEAATATPDKESLVNHIDAQPWVEASVSVLRELHGESSERSCLHAELEFAPSASSEHCEYEAGDHVALRCENEPAEAAALARRLGVSMNSVLRLETELELDDDGSGGGGGQKRYHVPSPCKVKQVLLRHLDITRPPSQRLLMVLAGHTSPPLLESGDVDDSEREWLLLLASKEGKEEYDQYVVHEERTVLEVLADCPSVAITLGQIAEFLPRLQPRFYSISSSPKAHPRSVHVTAAVVRYAKPQLASAGREQPARRREYRGVCTTWLSRLKVGKSKVQLYLRTSTFRLPKQLSVPVVMVGPGTGVAPFRGFLQDRAADIADRGSGAGEATLYFGCRREAEDFLYRDELRRFCAGGGGGAQPALRSLRLAFSREQEQKRYVQHCVREDGAQLWQLLSAEGAVLYVCGDAKSMAVDVHEALKAVVSAEGAVSAAEAAAWLGELKADCRFQQDTW